MSFSQPFVPLYFGEEDADLWRALQGIEPEKRSSFIKKALRSMIENSELARSSKELADSVIEGSLKKLLSNEEHNSGLEADDAHKDDVQIMEAKQDDFGNEAFALDDLFTVENQIPVALEVLAPWQRLLQEVIGVEEDEEVLAAFSQARTNGAELANYPVKSVEVGLNYRTDKGESVESQSFNLEDLRVENK